MPARPFLTGLLAAAARAVALAGLVVSGGCLLAILVLGAADALATNVLGRPVPSALELSEVLLATAVFGALPYAQWRATHVTVDLLTSRLPPRPAAMLAALAEATMLAVLVVLFLQSVALAQQSVSVGETASAYLPFPVYPAKVAAAVALGVTVLVAAVRLVLAVGDALARAPVREDRP